jgi:hypothetical protein
MKRPIFYIKRMAGVAVLLSMVCGTTVAAEGGSMLKFNGKGRITSDPNVDGVDDVVYDSLDVEALNKAATDTALNLDDMDNVIDDAVEAIESTRQKVIDAYNSKVFPDKIPDGSSADTIAGVIKGTKEYQAFLSYLAGTGENFTAKGEKNKRELELADIGGEVVLDVDQQVTLPAGYYEAPITVSNGVINRGTISHVFNGAGEKSYEEGYYTGGVISGDVERSASSYAWKVYHHVHSTANTTTVKETTNFDVTTDGPADNTRSSTRGGCFQKIQYHAHSTGSNDLCADRANAGPTTSKVKGGCFTSPVYKIHVHSDACNWIKTGETAEVKTGGETGDWPYEDREDALDAGRSAIGAPDLPYKDSTTSDAGHDQKRYATQIVQPHNAQTDDYKDDLYYQVNTCKKDSSHYHWSFAQRIRKHYRRGCGKSYGQRYADEGIDYYTPACNKNQTTPFYIVNCGKLRGQVVSGKFTTN